MAIPEIVQQREILARAGRCLTRRRAGEVEDLLLLLRWADSHSGDPRATPDPVPAGRGGPRLVSIGGEGTPQVVDLCFAEIAIARQASEVSTRNVTADALDLRHRLPRVWAQLLDLRCETWVARKIARMSRRLSREAVTVVDAAVAEAIGQSPSRLLTIAEAKVIEADQAAHHARIRQAQARRGVWFPTPQPGASLDEGSDAAGVRTVFGRLSEADAIELEHAIDDLAGVLADRGDHGGQEPTWDQLRADSLGLLARPGDALTLLHGEHHQTDPADQADPDPDQDQPQAAQDQQDGQDQQDEQGQDGQDQQDGQHGQETTAPGTPGAPAATGGGCCSHGRRHAGLVAHLTDTTLAGRTGGGVVRVEGIGPMLLEQLAALLGHRHIQIQPVIDLHDVRAVNGYEHPHDIRTRTTLRTLGDTFPHSASTPSARIDHDHPTPYDPTGPPGQTGDHNDAPLTRRHHRAKTHLRYRTDQLAPGAYRWATPHGLGRIVTPHGTQPVTLIRTPDGHIHGEIYPAQHTCPGDPDGPG